MKLRRALPSLIFALLALSCASIGESRGPEPQKRLVARIPDQTEIDEFFKLGAELAKIELSSEFDPATLDKAFGLVDGRRDLRAYLIEAFLRRTDNAVIKSRAQRYFADHRIDNQESRQIIKFFQRKPAQQGRMLLPDGTNAEEIDLSAPITIALFNSTMKSTIFKNPWSSMRLFGNPDNLYFTHGGGTNNMSMSYKRLPMPESQFMEKVVGVGGTIRNMPGWTIIDLSKEASLEGSNAEVRFLGKGIRTDEYRIKWDTTVYYLYSRTEKCGYEIDWTINFSYVNAFYDHPERICDYLSTVILFSWIEPRASVL